MAEQSSFSVEADPSFTPFWHRLPSFFAYPLQVGTLLRMGGFALAAGVALLILGRFGLKLNIILWFMFLKYAFVVLERTANGRFDEPNNMQGDEEGEGSQVWRMLGLLVLVSILSGVVSAFLGPLGLVLSLLMIIALPAQIMIIAATHSLGSAFNPAQIVFYVRTIGSPYLALCGLLMSLMFSVLWVVDFIVEHLDSWLVLPVIYFALFYFILITFHMMGYVVYQYHDQLGLHADVSYEQAEAKISPNKTPADPILAKLATLMAEGKEAEACGLLRDELRTHWERNDLHERYQKLLVALGKKEQALEHARDFIGKLMGERKLFQALDLCEKGMQTDPQFHPKNSDHVHELANAACMSNRHKLALDLMRGFDKRYPGHKHIPPVYLLSAKILDERYGKTLESGKILRALQAKFPSHPAASEARKYLEVLAKMDAATQKAG